MALSSTVGSAGDEFFERLASIGKISNGESLPARKLSPESDKSTGVACEPHGTGSMGKFGFKISGFPVWDRANSGSAWEAHGARTYQSSAVRVPIGSGLERRVADWPRSRCEGPDEKVFSSNHKNNRRMRKDESIQLSRLVVCSAKEHATALRRRP